MKKDIKILTIGHSTHSNEEFLNILKKYKIETLIDVRSYPGSKYVPHFNKETLKNNLAKNNIHYISMPELGGRRKKIEEVDYTLVDAWTHKDFKNYAAYTLTKDFEKGLNKLIKIAAKTKVCIMCAESLPWRCHRLIISNSLFFKKIEVFHILNINSLLKHEINKYGAYALLRNKQVIYPSK